MSQAGKTALRLSREHEKHDCIALLEVASQAEAQTDAQRARQQQDDAVQNAVAALAAGNSVRYNGCTWLLVGAGGSGKTSARHAVQDLQMDAKRQSTHGGDSVHLQFVEVTVQKLKRLQECGDTSMFHHAIRTLVAEPREAGAAAEETQELSEIVDGVGSFRPVAGHKAATGTGIQNSPGLKDLVGGAGTYENLARAKDTIDAKLSKTQEAHSQAPKKGGDAGAVGDSPVLPPSKPGASGNDSTFPKSIQLTTASGEHGALLTVLDMGGQPEFWQAICGFLRNRTIITVFGRLDELDHNLLHNKPLPNNTCKDSKLMGLQELMMWLDVITSNTTDGPVILVLSRADVISDEARWSEVSDRLLKILAEREHPVLIERLGWNDTLCFFPINGTEGLSGEGVRVFQDALQDQVEHSASVKQPVPVSLLHFQDALASLTKPATSDEHSVLREIRAGADKLFHINLEQAAGVYQAFGAARDNVFEGISDQRFRLFLDFLHMQGALTHGNEATVEDLVIIDPMWLLRMITRVVRRLLWPIDHEIAQCPMHQQTTCRPVISLTFFSAILAVAGETSRAAPATHGSQVPPL